MDANEREALFQEALRKYRQGDWDRAATDLQRLLKDGSREPRHISYCGLLLAVAEGKYRDGKTLCELAIREAFYEPEMYLNLALLYSRTGRSTKAIETLEQGLRIDPRDLRLRREFAKLNRRSPPLFRFLGRKNPLNKYSGLVRARLSQLVRKTG